VAIVQGPLKLVKLNNPEGNSSSGILDRLKEGFGFSVAALCFVGFLIFTAYIPGLHQYNPLTGLIRWLWEGITGDFWG
jgi:hypothetical protein